MMTRETVAGALSVLAAGALAGVADATFVALAPWVACAWGGVVAMLLRGDSAGHPAAPAWVWAIAVRAPLLVAPCALSDDVWRYVWEGHAWRAGFNPFDHAPDSVALGPLRARLPEVWEHVAHRSIPSIYPPGAQALFVLLAPGGVLAWRVLAAACDALTAHTLGRASPRAGLLWALLPLPALESAVSGHLEGVGVLLWTLALTRRDEPAPLSGPATIAAWVGAMVKVLPGVLLLRAGWRRALLGTLLGVAAAAPIVGSQAWDTYRTTWAFNGSVFPLLEPLLGGATRPVLQAVGATIVAAAVWRTRGAATLALWTSGALVCLSPVVHPWYVLWPLAPALLRGRAAWTALAALAPLSYVVLATYDPVTSRWSEATWTRWVVWLPFYVALAREAWTAHARRA
jgi:hypothetical protein